MNLEDAKQFVQDIDRAIEDIGRHRLKFDVYHSGNNTSWEALLKDMRIKREVHVNLIRKLQDGEVCSANASHFIRNHTAALEGRQ